jgi:hypothetical protein
MAKQGGMGDRFYMDGYDISGDMNSIARIGGGPAPWEVTDITKSGVARIGLLRDGAMDFTTYFDDAADQSFSFLQDLVTDDHNLTYMHGAAVGVHAASIVAKQVNFDPTRDQDGSLLFSVNAQANGFGVEWGEALTAGLASHSGAASGSSIDYGAASTAFGWAAYIHVATFTGTSMDINIQDSADNSSFTTLTGGTFSGITGGRRYTRLAGAVGSTVRRYVRVNTSGTFSAATFAVNFVRFLTAQP